MAKKQTEKKTMAKKTDAKDKTAARKPPKASAPAKKGAPVTSAPEAAAKPADATPVAPAAPNTPDPRLPAPGTVLQKKDRHGAVRCECTVEEGGIRYVDKVYRSLSSAAMAAARDLGLTNKTQNGFTFWGLSKPPRRDGDPIAALNKVWARYQERAVSISSAATDANREQVRDVLEQHSGDLAKLAKAV